MGAKPSKDEIKVNITNSINLEIANLTQNITDIMTKTINDTTMSMINESATVISGGASAMNQITGDVWNFTDSASLIINQEANVDALITATVNLVSDQSAMTELSNKLTQDLKAATTNDNALTAAMEAVNKIADAQKTAGGPEALVDSIMDGLTDTMTQFSQKPSSEQETTIRNMIDQKISNTTVNQNNISNTIENHMSTALKNVNSQTCDLKSSAINDLNVKEINMAKNTKVTVGQVATVKTALTCVISSVNVAGLVGKVVNDMGTKTDNTTSNTNKAGGDVTAENTNTKTVEKSSAIMESVDNATNSFMIVSIVIAIVIFLIVGGALFFLMKNPGAISEISSAAKSMKE
jgi:hypothetical protein